MTLLQFMDLHPLLSVVLALIAGGTLIETVDGWKKRR